MPKVARTAARTAAFRPRKTTYEVWNAKLRDFAD